MSADNQISSAKKQKYNTGKRATFKKKKKFLFSWLSENLSVELFFQSNFSRHIQMLVQQEMNGKS